MTNSQNPIPDGDEQPDTNTNTNTNRNANASANRSPAPDSSGNGLFGLGGSVDWTPLARIAFGALAGLAVNAVAWTAFLGWNLAGFVGGLAFLAPAVTLGAALFQRYTPTDRAYLAPALLFVTIALANTISLTVRVLQTFGGQSSPVMSVLIIAVVGMMFTPGPFVGAWAARRWWL